MGVAGIETAAETAVTVAAVIWVLASPRAQPPWVPPWLLGGSETPEGQSGRDASFQRGGDVAAPDAARARGNGAGRLRGAPAGGEQVGWEGARESGADG